jgi:flagellar hook-length control protein FliK
MNLPILPATPPARQPSTGTTMPDSADSLGAPSDPFSLLLAEQMTAVPAAPGGTSPGAADVARSEAGKKDTAPPGMDPSATPSDAMLAALLMTPGFEKPLANPSLASNASLHSSGGGSTSSRSFTSPPFALVPASDASPAGAATNDKTSNNSALPFVPVAASEAAQAASSQMEAQIQVQSQPHTQTPIPAHTQTQGNGPLPSFVLTLPSLPNVNAQVRMTLNAPLHHVQWADDFSQTVTWISSHGMQSAELHLNPPHLGPLDVTLSLSGNQVTAVFTSPHALVRDTVEQSLPNLREMMASSGIMLGNATVSDQGRHGQPSAPYAGADAAAPAPPGRATDIAVPSVTPLPAMLRHTGSVDTFA